MPATSNPLPAETFRAELQRLGVSQMDLSRALDTDPRTVRRWAAGNVPKLVLMLLTKLKPQEVAKLVADAKG
jgi:DNA-binding transcriptional regulator YiaG